MEQPLQPRKRIEFIDLLRGWAVIVMIETHVFNATLTPAVKAGGFFGVLDFINGLVAPSFLFASGLAYAVTTRRKINDYLRLGTPLFRQFGRLLLILLIGYILHIPKFSYAHCRYIANEQAWESFFQADVLHCIAVSLLLMQILLLIVRSEQRLFRAVGGLAIAVVVDFREFMPVPLAAYMNGMHDSLFPLFPWSAYVFTGALTGWYYLRAKDRSAPGETGAMTQMMRTAAGIGVALILASFVFHPIAEKLYPQYDYWHSSPSFFLLRLGLVLLLCSGMFAFERIRGVSPRSVVTLIGRESLIVYVTHLTMIYGNFGRFTFTEKIGSSFGYPEALLAAVILFLLMYLLAFVWGRMKGGSRRFRRSIETAFVATLVVIFFSTPAI